VPQLRPVPKRAACLLSLAVILFCGADGFCPGAKAAAVILLRHADKDVLRGDYNLSPKGFLRAIALARLIPGCFGNPVSLSSFYVNPDTSKNARSYQSAVPLGVASGVNIHIVTQSLEQSFDFGQQLRQSIAGTRGLHVLFWEHRRMPELARGLGWDAMPPIAEDDFDQLLLLRYDNISSKPRVQRLSQHQLFSQACFTRALRSSPVELDITPLLDADGNSRRR